MKRHILIAGLQRHILIAGLLLACSSPREESGRARNAIVGGLHAVELNECIQAAKDSDAGNQYAIYEQCAAGVDRKYGRKVR
jgi:hypothetical protein